MIDRSARALVRLAPQGKAAAPKLFMGALVVLLFGVDVLRPITDLSGKRPKNDSQRTAAADPVAKAPAKKKTADATFPAWSAPWLPPLAELGSRIYLEPGLRAASGSIRPTGQTGSGSSQVWAASGGNEFRSGLAMCARERISSAAPIKTISLIRCGQICPVGPPSA